MSLQSPTPVTTYHNSLPTSTSPIVSDPNPSTPSFPNDHQWISAYLHIHRLSPSSYRYMYFLWLVVIVALLVFSILHITRSRGSALGSLWNKWSLRRRTWRKQHSLAQARRQNKPHKQPFSFPPNSQLLSITLLYIATIFLCSIGPDYIAPSTPLLSYVTLGEAPVSLPPYTISKAWWTAGGRAGTIAFALFPLCVLFALKAPPFALFALPFLSQLYNDKLTFIHKWSGRLIWFVTALHVTFWGVQLGLDKRGPHAAWSYAFLYENFIFAWLAFIFLTLLVTLSLRPVRDEFYEVFYGLHVLFVPLTLIFSALHFPPLGWWCWSTLILWGAERLWRFVRFARINGIIGGIDARLSVRRSIHADVDASLKSRYQQEAFIPREQSRYSYASQVSKLHLISPTEMEANNPNTTGRSGHSRPLSSDQMSIRSFQTESSVSLMDYGDAPNIKTSRFSTVSGGEFPPTSPYAQPTLQAASYRSSRGIFLPPPGYAHAMLLPGRTVRLRFITPNHFTWAPGQHVSLTIPSISRFTSHPFTIASVCDEEAVSDEGRQVVLLVRKRAGFTKNLWSHVEQLETSRSIGDAPFPDFPRPPRGVLLRAYVDGPFGSSIRAQWSAYSTILLVAGGSGISFAVSVLEFACMCMAGRNEKYLGARSGILGHNNVSQIVRVRLVWLVREFSHIQWAGSQIRRCMDMVPASALQVDIFVTNTETKSQSIVISNLLSPPGGHGETLAPPSPFYAQRDRRNTNVSEISLDTNVSEATITPYMHSPQEENGNGNELISDIVTMYGELGHEEHVLDVTNFDGEDDTALPGERKFSRRLRKEGKMRRATRRMKHGLNAKELKTSRQPAEPVPPLPRKVLHPPSSSSPLTPLSEDIQSPNSATPLRNYDLLSPISNAESPITHHQRPISMLSIDSADESRCPSPAPSHISNNGAQARLKADVDEAEAEDMSIVAERARPGRPKMDMIIADEIGRTKGPTIVGCCGPTSLNALVRKTVAAHIDPARVFRGDARAIIALVSEDFEW